MQAPPVNQPTDDNPPMSTQSDWPGDGWMCYFSGFAFLGEKDSISDTVGTEEPRKMGGIR